MINDAIRQIRDTVNRGVFLHNIERHGFQWDMVSASLDVLGDTQLAIEAFQERRGDIGGGVGHGYLEAYGLFQAMFLQQDALTNLAEGLNLARVRVRKNPDYSYVRNLRNTYFGHPTKRTSGGKVTFHGITRISVGTMSLQGWTFPNFRTENIDVSQVLKRHESSTRATLKSIYEETLNKGKAYMSRFTEEVPISDHIYEFEKLYTWALGSKNGAAMAPASVEILDKELVTIERGITARYHRADQVGDVIREISKARYCLRVLRKGLEASKADSKSNFYYEAHIDSLKQTYEGIVEVCKGINADFKQSTSN